MLIVQINQVNKTPSVEMLLKRDLGYTYIRDQPNKKEYIIMFCSYFELR